MNVAQAPSHRRGSQAGRCIQTLSTVERDPSTNRLVGQHLENPADLDVEMPVILRQGLRIASLEFTRISGGLVLIQQALVKSIQTDVHELKVIPGMRSSIRSRTT